MRNESGRAIAGLLLLLVVGFVGFFAGRFAVFAFRGAVPGSQESTIVEVHKGEGPNEITRILTTQGVIRHSKDFVWLGRITRQWRRIKAGEYKLSPAMSPIEIFSVLTSGISVAHPVTVREGENMYEVAADIASKGLATQEKFLGLCKSATFIDTLGLGELPIPSLEGYLFPDTYFFNKSMTAEEMVRQMVHRFLAAWSEPEMKRAKELSMTRHQVVTLASIIEKETGAPEERPMISSVFYNRLHKKMKLQSDPTTIYGMWERYHGKIHRSDLAVANPFNTYYIPALPIGPIANPGVEAIKAALFPAESEYLYFVSHNDGTHQFSSSLEQHNAAVRKFQLDPKAREGKSWRDLRKKLTNANINPQKPANH